MKVFYFAIFLCSLELSYGYNILGIFPLQSKSHMMLFENLMKSLAEKGHEVDVVSHFPQKKPFPRYNDLSVRGTLPIFVNNFSVAFISQELTTTQDVISFIINGGGIEVCNAVLNSDVLKNLKQTTKKYDLVITEIFGTDCMLGFAHLFQVPAITVTSSVDLPWGGVRYGNPDNPSYIPNYFVSYLSKMTLMERVINTVILIASKTAYEWSYSRSTRLSRGFFGEDLPDLRDLAANASLHLVNSHFSINQARPTVPNFVEIGGLHIEPPKPLSKHFEDSLKLSGNYKGIIYLSTGSMVMTETMPIQKLKALMDSFRELPYKVLWKADVHKMPKDLDIPPNIQFEPWMPQMDILCHPNVKLFVTHGGLMGSQEGIFCGVPRLGIPFFADQALNLKSAEAMGVALMIRYDDVTTENVLKSLKELLNNPKYKNNAERLSKAFRDRPMTAKETAIYWIEYVIRHNGAPQLRSVAADLPWYQYYLVDVSIVIGVIIATGVTVIYYATNLIINVVFGDKRQLKSKRE